MPPTAASAGSAAWRGRGQLPPQELALDLEPDQEEEHAIRPSLIQSSSGLSIASGPTRTPTGVSRKPS